MIYYTNGIISYNLIPNETTLVISVSDNTGTPLQNNLHEIIKQYGKLVSCICLSDKTDNKKELVQILKTIKSMKLKVCVDSRCDDVSKLSQNIANELNYIILNNKIMIKDYSPFGDIEDWVEIS